jgi:hypothetical protein
MKNFLVVLLTVAIAIGQNNTTRIVNATLRDAYIYGYPSIPVTVGLAMHLRADMDTYTNANGTALVLPTTPYIGVGGIQQSNYVGGWKDQVSTNNIWYFKESSLDPPVLINNGIGGQRALAFGYMSGTAKTKMLGTNGAWFNYGIAVARSNFTIVVVQQLKNNVESYPTMFSWGANKIQFRFHNQTRQAALVDSATATTIDPTATPLLSPRVMVGIIDQVGDKFWIYTNAVEATQNFVGEPNVATLPTGSNVCVGALLGNGVSQFFQGNIGEVIAYNRALSPAEITTLTSWLRQRYSF